MRILLVLFLLSPGILTHSQESNLKLTVNFSEDISDSVFLSINKKTYPAFVQGNSVVFNATVKEATRASIRFNKTNCLLIFYTDPGEMELITENFETSGRPCISQKELKGSKTEDVLSAFDKEHQKINRRFIAAAANKNLKQLSNNMIETYRHSFVSIDVIHRVKAELGKEWTETALNMIDDSISLPAKDHIMRTFMSDELLRKGNYIDFTQSDIDGFPFTLSSLKGKYVLLDFWASWCIPCRKENPKLKLLYEQYKEKGLEVIGVSLDTNEEKWKEAVEKDDLPWIHISDLKGFNNEISSTLGIRSIPTTILIDPEGKIVDFNLRGNELEKAIEKWLSNKD